MIIYLGMTGKREFVDAMKERGIGRIMQRGLLRLNSLYPGERWCFDNGAFADWTNGREFNDEQFWADLTRIERSVCRPQFVVAPDLPGQPRSIWHSYAWMQHAHAWARDAFRWYLPVQDGTDPDEVGEMLALGQGYFAGLFIGGTDKFKATAPQWATVAHTHGLPCHYGRASTPAKLQHARSSGCDSADTSHPLWESKRFWRWLATGSGHQDHLFAHKT